MPIYQYPSLFFSYKEKAKIKCGKAHFSALAVGESPATYRVAKDLNELFD